MIIRMVILTALVACASTGTDPSGKATPISNHKTVLNTLRVVLPQPVNDRAKAQAYAKELFTKLEMHFGEVEGISPTQFGTGSMHRSLTYHDVHIYMSVDERLGDDAVIAKLKSYAFKTRVVWNKQTTVTEAFAIKNP